MPPVTRLVCNPFGTDRQASEINTTLLSPLSRAAMMEALSEIASLALFGAPERSHTSELTV